MLEKKFSTRKESHYKCSEPAKEIRALVVLEPFNRSSRICFSVGLLRPFQYFVSYCLKKSSISSRFVKMYMKAALYSYVVRS